MVSLSYNFGVYIHCNGKTNVVVRVGQSVNGLEKEIERMDIIWKGNFERGEARYFEGIRQAIRNANNHTLSLSDLYETIELYTSAIQVQRVLQEFKKRRDLKR